jgi:hypothetical protein
VNLQGFRWATNTPRWTSRTRTYHPWHQGKHLWHIEQLSGEPPRVFAKTQGLLWAPRRWWWSSKTTWWTFNIEEKLSMTLKQKSMTILWGLQSCSSSRFEAITMIVKQCYWWLMEQQWILAAQVLIGLEDKCLTVLLNALSSTCFYIFP